MKKKIILVDSYNFFYKAYHAFFNHPLTNSKGEMTSVIFSFLNLLVRISETQKPSLLICVSDARGKTHRHKLFDAYKANRPPMSDDLRIQIEALKVFIKLLGIPLAEQTGLEADDIIASYASAKTDEHEHEHEHEHIEIFSSDKDLHQLVTKRVSVLKSPRDASSMMSGKSSFIEMDEAAVLEKFKVAPRQLADYLALVGDASDNVPGVKGVGPVMAVKLLQQYSSLKEIYENLDNLDKKVAKKLFDSKEKAMLSYRLVKLPSQEASAKAIVIAPLESLAMKPIVWDELEDGLRRYECFSILKKLSSAKKIGGNFLELVALLEPLSSPSSSSKKNKAEGELSLFEGTEKSTKRASRTAESVFEDEPARLAEVQKALNIVFQRETHSFVHATLAESDIEILAKIRRAVHKTKRMCFDFETNSLDVLSADIVSMVIVAGNSSFYLHFMADEKSKAISSVAIEAIKDLFEDGSILKIAHNLKFEYALLRRYGIKLAEPFHDTLLFEYILHSDRYVFKLEKLVYEYFALEKPDYKELQKPYENIFEIPQPMLASYTFEDGETTEALYRLQCKKQEEKLSSYEQKLFRELEMPLISVLSDTEHRGVLIDVPWLLKLEKRLEELLGQYEQNIYELSGEVFNINSVKELQQILFQKLALPVQKKMKTGYSTDHRVLAKLSNKYPIAKEILAYRKAMKMLSTYVRTLPKLVHASSARVHTSYQQYIASTGRLSSKNPNLQNIPIGKESFGIRQAFRAPKGYKLVSIDYSQVELRILAELSRDEKLLQAYRQGDDVHQQTAAILFSENYDAVTPLQRSIGKTINFSVIYGVSAFSLAEQLHLEYEHAKKFIEAYFANYPQVKEYRQKVLEEAGENGFVCTYYGRRRYLPGIRSSQQSMRLRSERMAFNSVIQGTASDIIKFAMLEIEHAYRTGMLQAQMVMQVHDELVFYIPENRVAEELPHIERMLENVKPFNSILKVSSTISETWEKALSSS